MEIADGLIELRILLNKLCDGFSSTEASKNSSLSIKYKILFLLQDEDLSPSELINNLCIAKSNLANILKSIIEDKLVISYKNINNSKNINYRITDLGRSELDKYKDTMLKQFHINCTGSEEQLSKKLIEIIQLLKGNQND